MLLTERCIGHIQQRAKWCGHTVANTLFNVILWERCFVEHTTSGRAFPKPRGYRQMDLSRHQITQFMNGKGCMVGHDSLGFALAIVTPKRQVDEVFTYAGRIIAQPKDAMVYSDPVTASNVEMLLAVGLTNLECLGSGKVPPLIRGNLEEFASILLWISTHG
ncbi:MAG: hypothetical protein H8D43_03895 [Chloroflexi bacterium]|nr:hypothetical protein [Chloroflexota bacterium]